MNVLGLDTSTRISGLCLRKGNDIFLRESEGTRHSSGLFIEIEDLLREADLTVRDLDAVAVGLGPGSFTGIRIGVTAAKSLAWSLDIPAGGVSSFQGVAAALVPESISGGDICIISDARMNEYFIGLYCVESGYVREQKLGVVGKEELGSLIGPETVIAGPAAEGVEPEGEYCLVPGFDHPSALKIIEETERTAGFETVLEHDLEPLYLKKSEPERRGSSGRGKGAKI